MNIYVNGIRVIRDLAAMNNLPGIIRMFTKDTAGAVYKFRNVKLYSANYTQYVPTLTETRMWGHLKMETIVLSRGLEGME